MNLLANQAPDIAGLPGALAGASPIPLGCPWDGSCTVSPGQVRLAWCPDALLVRAELADEEVFTSATRDSEYLWELGDVFEVFLTAEGAGFYTEMHVAPGNLRLHLKFGFEDLAAMVEKKLFPKARTLSPPGFQSRFELISGGWAAEVLIPAAAVDPSGFISPQSRWRGSFCRYDAWPDGRPPVISSTSPHKEPISFHNRHEWRPLCF